MDSLPPVPEIIGLFVAIILALIFMSYMLYAKGRDAGLPRQRVTRMVVGVWVMMFAMLAMLFGLRALIGTPIVEGSPSTGGISIAHMTTAKWIMVAVAAALVAAASLWLRGVVQQLEPKPSMRAFTGQPEPPGDEE